MIKQQIQAAIIEPSHIIYEGLANILLKSEHHFQLYRLENTDELIHHGLKDRINVVIINPLQIQNNVRSFIQTRQLYSRIKWIGLIYSYFDKETISLFDSIIHITDLQETILNIISRQTQTNQMSAETTGNEQISEREMDVLIQLVHGLSNKEIADKLNISIHTVVSHRKNIIQKTGIKSQAGLTIYAISKKIISLDSTLD
ncbi:MAG: LuxR C-terminal-related transcriptional regulator [Bacteroidota bacterium]